REPLVRARCLDRRRGDWGLGTCAAAECQFWRHLRSSARAIMTVPTASEPAARPVATHDFLGHPRGLAVLFATEAWERFSYFGNAALVVLYMTLYLFDAGRPEAVLGLRHASAALVCLFGGLEAPPIALYLLRIITVLALL